MADERPPQGTHAPGAGTNAARKDAATGSVSPLRGQFAAGTATASPGERAFGHIPVPLPDGEALSVPCWVVQGQARRGQAHPSGPVLYVHSTQHGNEISGIEVVRRVAQAIDPSQLRGTVVAV